MRAWVSMPTNQLSTRTDSKGNALLTGLRSYQKNSVRIEQSDIPLDAQIDTSTARRRAIFS